MLLATHRAVSGLAWRPWTCPHNSVAMLLQFNSAKDVKARLWGYEPIQPLANTSISCEGPAAHVCGSKHPVEVVAARALPGRAFKVPRS